MSRTCNSAARAASPSSTAPPHCGKPRRYGPPNHARPPGSIDRAFVKDIDRDSNDAAICTTVVVLAHNLGVKVCAEGVEDAAQAAFLTSHQCDVLQGYYFSEPLLPDAVAALLERDGRFAV